MVLTGAITTLVLHTVTFNKSNAVYCIYLAMSSLNIFISNFPTEQT